MSLTNKALFIIERNLTSALTLASIAENCEASRFHLAHAFGESTGFSVMDYVRARRLTEAARALASEDEEGGLSYVCAAEVTRFGRIPWGRTKVTLGPSTYLVFEHQAHVTELDQTYAAIWDEWLPSSGRKPADAPGLQRHNLTFDPRTGNGGVTIWIPVVA